MSCCETIILTTEPQTLVITTQEPNQLNILSIGEQGPQGVAGLSGTSFIPNVNSGSNIGGHRIVYLDTNGDARYASSDNIAHLGKVVGITTSSSTTGSPVEIRTMGKFEEPSWNFDVNLPIYLGIDGLITQVTPSLPNSLFSQIVGYVVNPTTVYIQLQTPITLT